MTVMRRSICILAISAVLLAHGAPSAAAAPDQDLEVDTDTAAPALTPEACVPAPEGESNCAPEAAELAIEESPERILDYRSHIVVATDGGLTVTETIEVLAAGEHIKRGIYRDFPTIYGSTVTIADEEIPLLRREVPFDVVDVQRDGHPEPSHTERQDNGVRIYVGDDDVMLPPGRYTYTLTYKTARQLGFFDDHDELYWNVTGNGWAFPIDRATATVTLPAAIPRQAVRREGYTGRFGSDATDLTTSVDRRSGDLEFTATTPLDSYEGLTIVAAFPKGFIQAPTEAEERAALLRANPVLVIGPVGLALAVLYFVGAWLAVGRDPSRGTIIPLFEPPLGLEAASLRYVGGMGYDERCFTAALVGLATKGWARIADKDGKYTITRSGERHTPLGTGEKRVNSTLLGGNSIELVQANHSKIRSAISGLREALKLEYDGRMFRANRKWLIPGLVLSALVVIVCGFSGPFESSFAFGFMMIWLTGWTFACFHLFTRVWGGWRAALRPGAGAFDRIGSWMVALISTAFAIPFFLGEAFGLFMLVKFTSVLMVPVLLVMVGLNFLFFQLLKQPTVAGRKLMDQIAGFRMYLTTAEGAELAHAAPAKTPQLYERLLPYAIALEVENEWAEQFSDVLAHASDGSDADGKAYQPLWFSGSSFNHLGATDFASALSSSLSSTISSSSTAPSSSSGSSGGGSSGGGGGGGGGGGW